MWYRIWYAADRKMNWEEIKAESLDDCLGQFNALMGNRKFRVVQVCHNVKPGGPEKPQPQEPAKEEESGDTLDQPEGGTMYGFDNPERAEWWQRGEKPPEDFE